MTVGSRRARAAEPARAAEALRRVRRAELPADTVALARVLIGMRLVSERTDGRVVARIVETEAYLPGDAACHAFAGETARNATLFRRRGLAYVYFIYGVHFCVNVSSEREGIGAGVLVRAGEVVDGLALAHARRPKVAFRDLCRGPGRLARALDITRADDGVDRCAPGRLWLATPAPDHPRPPDLGRSPRIGITKEADRLLRFFERGSPFVSGPRVEKP